MQFSNIMKASFILTSLCIGSFALLTSCGEKPSDSTASKNEAYKGSSCSKCSKCNHDDHDHEHHEEGPNGGVLITDLSPHAEFLTLDDGKVQVSFFDEEMQPIPPKGFELSVTTGEAISPIELSFVEKDDSLVSEHPLPDGDAFPTSITLKSADSADAHTAEFTLHTEGH
jgi:hypothetical protein